MLSKGDNDGETQLLDTDSPQLDPDPPFADDAIRKNKAEILQCETQALDESDGENENLASTFFYGETQVLDDTVGPTCRDFGTMYGETQVLDDPMGPTGETLALDDPVGPPGETLALDEPVGPTDEDYREIGDWLRTQVIEECEELVYDEGAKSTQVLSSDDDLSDDGAKNHDRNERKDLELELKEKAVEERERMEKKCEEERESLMVDSDASTDEEGCGSSQRRLASVRAESVRFCALAATCNFASKSNGITPKSSFHNNKLLEMKENFSIGQKTIPETSLQTVPNRTKKKLFADVALGKDETAPKFLEIKDNALVGQKTNSQIPNRTRELLADVAHEKDANAPMAGLLEIKDSAFVGQKTNSGNTQKLLGDVVLEKDKNAPVEGLTYLDSQEPGDLSQANALEVVDRIISLDNIGLTQEELEGEREKRECVKLPAGSLSKIGTCQLAVKVGPMSPVMKAKVFDWIDSNEDERGGELFAKRKYSFFENKGKSKKSQSHLAKKVRERKSADLARSDSRVLVRRDMGCELRMRKNLFEGLGERTNGGYLERETTRENRERKGDGEFLEREKAHVTGIGENPLNNSGERTSGECLEREMEGIGTGTYQVGPDTQMAAETIHSLVHGSCRKSVRSEKENFLNENSKGNCRPDRERNTQNRRNKKTSRKRLIQEEDISEKDAPVASRTRNSRGVKLSDQSENLKRKRGNLQKGVGESKDTDIEQNTTPILDQSKNLKKKQIDLQKDVGKSNDTVIAHNATPVLDQSENLKKKRADLQKDPIIEHNATPILEQSRNLKKKRADLQKDPVIEHNATPILEQSGNLKKKGADLQKHNTSPIPRKTRSSRRINLSGQTEISPNILGQIAKVANSSKIGSKKRVFIRSATEILDKAKRQKRENLSNLLVLDQKSYKSKEINQTSPDFTPRKSRDSLNLGLSRPSVARELLMLETVDPPVFKKFKNLRKRKDLAGTRVLFSHHLGQDLIKKLRKILVQLSVLEASGMSDATHFVADKFVRTKNMLEAIAMGKPVVTSDWLMKCGGARRFIDERDYILRDFKKEKEIGFSMPYSLSTASHFSLLQGKRVFITPNVKPSQVIVTSLVLSSGGQPMERIGRTLMKEQKTPKDLLVISCEEDYEICVPLLERGAGIFSSELLLNGMVIQKLEFERYRLFSDFVKRTRSTIWLREKEGGKFVPVSKCA